jgi:hypothetical protein
VSRWAKMDAGLDSNPKIFAAGRGGREVFLFLLRRNALLEADGAIPATNVMPEYLARHLDMPVTEARDAVTAAVTHGLIAIEEGLVRFLGWDTAWQGPRSDAERAAAYRQRKASKPADGNDSAAPNHDASRPSRDVTLRVTESHRFRGEEKRGEKSVGGRRAPTPMPEGWEPNEAARKKAAELGLNADVEASEFRDWTAAKGRTYADWQAAFRTHLASEAKRAKSSGAAAGSGAPLKLFGSTVGRPFPGRP